MATQSKLVKPENVLKKKAGNGGFLKSDLAKAQAMIETNEIDFAPVAYDLVAELGQVIAEIKSGALDQKDHFNKLLYPLMQLKSQGGLFRYPLITKISHVMLDFLENIKVLDQRVLEILEAYKKSITAILTLEIKDIDSSAGNELCDALTDVCARYFKSIAKA